MRGTYGNVDDLNAAKADDWLHKATQDTESFLRNLGWSGSQPKDETPALDIRLPTAEEYHASAPWRDLDPVKSSATTASPEAATSSAPPQGSVRPSGAPGVPAAMPSASSATAPRGDPSGGVEQWSSIVDEASKAYGVPPDKIKGIMHIESGGRTHDAQGNPLRSSAGAIGLMQTMPFHYQAGENPDDPRTNIMRGTKILADNYARYHDWDKAAAAYFGAIDGNGNITGASDGNTDGYGYVRQFNEAAARYQGGAPSNAGATPPAQASPAAAASSPPPSAAGASGTVTLRHKVTGAISTLPASLLPGMTNRNEFDIVPDQTMQKVGDTQTSDEPGLSPGDQKRPKMAAAAGQPQPMPDGSAPYDWQLPAGQQPPLDSQRHIVPFDPATQQDADPGTMGIRYRQPLGGPNMGPDTATGDYTADGVQPSGGDATVPDTASSGSHLPPAPTSGYNDPTADGTLSQPLPLQNNNSDSNVSPDSANPLTVGSGDTAPSPADDPGGAQFAAQDSMSQPQQSAPFTPPSGLQAVYDAGGNFLHWIQGVASDVGQSFTDPTQSRVTSTLGEPDYVDRRPRGVVEQATDWMGDKLSTPTKMPTPQSPVIAPDAEPRPAEMTMEQRERVRQGGQLSPDETSAIQDRRAEHTTLSPQDEARALPSQVNEATRQSVREAAQSFADAIRSGQEGQPLAAAGNTLWGIIQAAGLPWTVAARTINEVLPEMNIAGIGPGDAMTSVDLLRDGIKGVNALKNAPGRLLSPDNLARADEAVSGIGSAIRGGVESAGRGIRGALDTNAERVAAPGEMQLGSGVVPDGSRRMYHGTASEFGRPDPSKFDEHGLFGPGYYVTSDPQVASSYSVMRGKGVSPWSSPGAGADVDPIGANVRRVNLPDGLNLLDSESRGGGNLTADALIRGLTGMNRDIVEQVRTDHLVPPDSGFDLYNRLARDWGIKKEDLNQGLAAAGYDGIAYDGGKRIGLKGDDGQVIKHTAINIFPGSLDKIRNGFSGEAGGSGVIPSISPGVRSAAYNAAQGGVLGTVAANEEEQRRGEPMSPGERLAYQAGTAGLAVVAGNRGARQAVGRALGSGFVPRGTRQTVEVLQQRLKQAQSIVDRVIQSGDPERIAMAQENRAAIESALADAQNARRSLEPRIRSDVGARESAIPPSGETVENRMDAIRPPRDGRMRAEDLSGPVSIPVDNPQMRLGSGFVPDEGPRYDPRLSQEPVLPGFEEQAPRTTPTVRGEPGDAAAQAEMRAGGGALPGLERQAAERFAATRDVSLSDDAARAQQEMRAGGAALPGMEREASDRFAAVRDAANAGDPAAQAEMRAYGAALPGMEAQAADRFAPVRDAANPGDAAAQQEMRISGGALPGMEGLASDRFAPARNKVQGATPGQARKARAEMRGEGDALPGLEGLAADRFAPVRDAVPGATASEAAQAIAEMRTSHLPPAVARALQAKEKQATMAAEKGITRPSAWDWIKQAGYAGIYGPATLVNSAIGGAQELVLGGVKEGVRAAVEGRPIVTRASARAQVGAAVEGLTNLGRVLVGDADKSAAASGGSQGTLGLSDRVAGKGAKLAARALERPGEILTEAPDAVFRPLFRSQGMEREASRVAAQAGLPKAQRAAYAQQLIQDAEAVRGGELATLPETQRVLDAGEKYADILGYKGKPGAFAQWLGKASKRDDIIGVAASFLMPFPAMAARMTEAALKSTPGVGLLPGIKGMHASKFDMVYDQAFGAVVASGIAYWAMNDGITGSGPDDKEKRDQMISQGWQPNSTLVGGHYIPNRMFQRFQPMLDTAGELHDALAYGKPGGPQIVSDLIKRGSKIATDQTGLSGLADLHDMLEGGFSSQFPGFAARSITRYVPYGGVLRAAAASFDSSPRKADRWTEGLNPLPAIGENIKTAVPGLRQTVPGTQDVLGRPAENPQQGLGAIIPRTTTAKNDPLIRQFQDAGVDISSPSRDITISLYGPDGKVAQSIPMPLTGAEQRRWNELRGTALQGILRGIQDNPKWATAPADTKRQYLQSQLTVANDYATRTIRETLNDAEITRRIAPLRRAS